MAKNKKVIRAKITALNAQRTAFRKSLRTCEREISKLTTKVRRRMRPGGGRSKGNGFENVIAKKIVTAFKAKVTDCYRTPGSGGHRYASKKDPGDLFISKRLRARFPFSVECKFYKEVDLYPFWLPQKRWGGWAMAKWIEQAVAATKLGTYPMVVFKQNKKEVMCVLPGVYPAVANVTARHQFTYSGETWFLVRFDRLLRILAKADSI